MAKINVVKNVLSNPSKIIRILGDKGIFNWMPDKQYLKLVYRAEMNKKLNLDSPITFNEKLQWIKLYDRKSKYSTMVDKYEVRPYIAEKIGEEYLIPLIGVYDSVDEIVWDDLPNQFVLKCTHGSCCNVICQNKDDLDIEKSKSDLRKWMKKNWYWFGREWPYKNVKPRINAEEFIKSRDGGSPVDYKIFCFNGEADNVMVSIERDTGNPRHFFFDRRWNLLRYNIAGLNAPDDFTLDKPQGLDEMFELASVLSMGTSFLRVDFYCEDGKIYFGELTFFPASGFDKNFLPKTDKLFGEKLDLKL